MTAFTFEKQAQYFAKKLNLKTDSYLDVMGKQHDYWFMVAGANRNEVLLAFREAVDEAIHNGATLEQFRQRFDEIVAKTGWDYNGGRNWRSRIIYDTNVYGAYNRGRLEQHLELADVLPYWEYQHNDNAHPRPEHQSWDGLVLRADDPWWRYHYPIKAYGCHCTVIAHDEDDLKDLGKQVQTAPEVEFIDKTVGIRSGNPRVVTVAKGTDVGFEPWDYDYLLNGQKLNVDQVLMQRLITAEPKFAATAVANVLAYEGATKLLNESFAQTVQTVAKEKVARGTMKYVGVLPEPVIAKLDSLQMSPQSAVIAMQDKDILHAIRDSKSLANIELPVSFWEKLPEHLQHPSAVLLDHQQDEPTLLFVYKTEQGKVAIKLNFKLRLKNPKTGKKETAVLNMVRTGSAMKDFSALYDFDVLWGSLD